MQAILLNSECDNANWLLHSIKEWVDINEYKYVCIELSQLAGKIDNMHCSNAQMDKFLMLDHSSGVKITFLDCVTFKSFIRDEKDKITLVLKNHLSQGWQ